MWHSMVGFESMLLLRIVVYLGSGPFTKHVAVFRDSPMIMVPSFFDVEFSNSSPKSSPAPRLSSKRMPNMSPLLTPNQIQSRKPGLRLSGSIGRAQTAVTVPWGSRPRM